MPRFESVQIVYNDDPTPYWAKVCINDNWTEEEDDGDIFFYFSTEAEFEEAKKENNGLEFRIIEEVI
jgi:hypothetical protein